MWAIHDGDGRRGVPGVDDQVAFQVPDLGAVSGGGWAPDDRPELAQHQALLLAGAASPATAPVVQMAPQPQVEPAVFSVDRLGDRLVAHAFVSSDRHRRLPVLQTSGDTPSQLSVFYEPRGLGPSSAAFRSTMRSGRHIACPSAVAVHVPSDPPHRTFQSPSDLAQRLASHQPDPDLLTLTQPQGADLACSNLHRWMLPRAPTIMAGESQPPVEPADILSGATRLLVDVRQTVATARWASRRPPRTVALAYWYFFVWGSRPMLTRTCQTPGDRSRMLPCTGPAHRWWTDCGQRPWSAGEIPAGEVRERPNRTHC